MVRIARRTIAADNPQPASIDPGSRLAAYSRGSIGSDQRFRWQLKRLSIGPLESSDPLTLFEYVAIAYCLVISFAVARAASVLPHALAPAGRYWVHATWVFANLGFCLLIFWNFWSFREVEWTLGSLCLQLAIPTSAFVFATIVAPEEPAKNSSWREYFYSVRVKLFSCGLVVSMLVALSSTALLKMPLAHPARLVQAAMFGVCLVGVLSDRPRVHAALAILVLTSFAFNAMRLFAAAGALAPGS